MLGSSHSCGGFIDVDGGSGNDWVGSFDDSCVRVEGCGACDHASMVALVIVVMALVKVMLSWWKHFVTHRWWMVVLVMVVVPVMILVMKCGGEVTGWSDGNGGCGDGGGGCGFCTQNTNNSFFWHLKLLKTKCGNSKTIKKSFLTILFLISKPFLLFRHLKWA